MSRVVFFEINTQSPDVTMRFFRKVFGWEFSRLGKDNCWLTRTGADIKAGINGGISLGATSHINNFIEVDSISSIREKIEKYGGEIVDSKESNELGHWIYFNTPDKIKMAAIELNKPF